MFRCSLSHEVNPDVNYQPSTITARYKPAGLTPPAFWKKQ
jgi:hypothetical protein